MPLVSNVWNVVPFIPCICLFVNPGHNSKDYPPNRFRASNRADEYDVLNDKYVTMLIDEIIPELKKKYNISNDPRMHGIAGLSSGAICAFTAAWHWWLGNLQMESALKYKGYEFIFEKGKEPIVENMAVLFYPCL